MAELVEITKWEAPRQLIAAHKRMGVTGRLSPPPWNAALDLTRICKEMSEAESGHFLQLYRGSKQRLLPLSDPLDARFPLHRQLSGSREEVYSDWLQWVLEQIKDIQRIGRILRSPNLERFATSQEPIRVEREVVVEHGYIGQTGRPDLVLKQGSQLLAVIEVKTRAYEDSDLKKHEGYRESINSPDTELIFLAIDPPDSDSDLFDFRYLSWADVCVTLRAIAPSLLLEQKRVLGTALILAFVGAVEQRSLGFVSPETDNLPIAKVPRMVDHLTKAARMEGRLGEQ